MASLYQISDEILSIFNIIEQNDGEMTDELSNLLAVKEDELSKKLNDYVKALQVWKSDIDACKQEEKRIKEVRNKYNNRIEKLKENMLTAVKMFGKEGATNKFIELPTCRIFTRNSKSIEVDEGRINLMIQEFMRYVAELVHQGVLYTGEDVDIAGVVAAINANCIAEYGEDFKPFTIDDFLHIRLDICCTDTIYNYFRHGGDLLTAITKLPTNITHSTTKDQFKFALDANFDISTAKVVNNESINIK